MITLSNTISVIFIKFIYKFNNTILLLVAYLIWPKNIPANVNKILIYRIGNIGDITCALPAMKSIRRKYPKAVLTLLTSPGGDHLPSAKDLLVNVSWIDAIHIYRPSDIATFTGKLRLVLMLRAQKYDIWFNLSPSAPVWNLRRELRDIFFAACVRPRWARGWCIDTIQSMAQDQSRFIFFPNEVDRLLAVTASQGFDPFPIEFDLPRNISDVKIINEIFTDFGGSKIVALAPGCKRETNKWPEIRFAEVANYLNSLGVGLILIGGKSDIIRCNLIAELSKCDILNLAGKLSIPQSIEAIRRCSSVVCVDSGVQHLAAAVGIPVVSIFSFWQMRGKWYPFGNNNTIFQKWVNCNTCLIDKCPNNNRCVNLTTIDEVNNAILEKL